MPKNNNARKTWEVFQAEPPEVMALQYTGDNLLELQKLNVPLISWNPSTKDLTIKSFNAGQIVIHPGDFVINHEETDDRFYAMSPYEFKQKYRPKHRVLCNHMVVLGDNVVGRCGYCGLTEEQIQQEEGN